MLRLLSPLLICVIVGSAPLVGAASAQETAGATVAVSRVPMYSSLLADGFASRTQSEKGRTSPLLAAGDEQKDPMIAGVASLLIPGLGSFYAGNTRHGVIHLGIAVASYGLISVAFLGDPSCRTLNCVNSTATAVYVAFIVYLANDVWSIFTAVSDAHAFNATTERKPGRVIGNLYIDPALQHLGTEPTPRGAVEHTGLQLARLTF